MSQQLQPSTAAITAADLPDSWIEAVRSALIESGAGLRRGGADRIEVHSQRTQEWHSLSPIFVTPAERDIVLDRVTGQRCKHGLHLNNPCILCDEERVE